MRSMRLDNTPYEEDQVQTIKEDAVEVVLDNHLGTTEVCPVCISKHVIGVLGSCGKG
jgi:hypothetical protein